MNNDRMNNRKFQDLKLIILFDGWKSASSSSEKIMAWQDCGT
jgi:hypothetical protein